MSTGSLTNRTVTSAATVTDNDVLIFLNVTSGAYNQTLPAASAVTAGKNFTFVNTGTSTATFTDTISGLTNRTLATYGAFTITTDGSSWYLV